MSTGNIPPDGHDPFYSLLFLVRELHHLLQAVAQEQVRQGAQLSVLANRVVVPARDANLTHQPRLLDLRHGMWIDLLQTTTLSEKLNRREIEALGCFMACRGDDDAAGDLIYIAGSTVRRHIQHIYPKVGIDSTDNRRARYELMLVVFDAVLERHNRQAA